MAKRFIDTDLFRKPLMRSLEAPYKALWIYLLCECDHAGVWDVELDVAQMRMGMKIDPEKAIEKLRGSAIPIDGGAKWFLPEFVAFQYGTLNPANRVHASVLSVLSKYGIDPNDPSQNKGLVSSLQGAKDKDKEKDTQEVNERARSISDRVADFAAEAKRINGEKKTLPDHELQKFIAYWTQAGDHDRKFHAEKQQTFGIAARLLTWGSRMNGPAAHKPEHSAQRQDLKTTW